jgi:hypothetical protein
VHPKTAANGTSHNRAHYIQFAVPHVHLVAVVQNSRLVPPAAALVAAEDDGQSDNK